MRMRLHGGDGFVSPRGAGNDPEQRGNGHTLVRRCNGDLLCGEATVTLPPLSNTFPTASNLRRTKVMSPRDHRTRSAQRISVMHRSSCDARHFKDRYRSLYTGYGGHVCRSGRSAASRMIAPPSPLRSSMKVSKSALLNEINQLVTAQIEAFRQPSALTDQELRKFRRRSETLKLLYFELDQLTAIAFRKKQLKKVS